MLAAPAAAALPALPAQRLPWRTRGVRQCGAPSGSRHACGIAARTTRRAAPPPPAAAAHQQQHAAATHQQQQQEQQQRPAEELPPLLSGVRIVLVSPKTPANIGAVLRVAENFEAHDVVVVDPRCDPCCDEVAVTSCFSPLLQRLRVAPSLANALADCSGSIGFTRRAGGGRLVHASLRQLLARFPAAIPALLQPPSGLQQLAAAAADGGASAGGSSGEAAVAAPAAAAAAATAAATAEGGAAAPGIVALVFGREESGLLDNELLLCSHACAIPTGRSQPSLNLSHAVAVVLSQLFDVQQQRLLAEQQGQQQQEEEVAEARGGQPQEQLPAGGLQDSLERAGTGAGGSLLSGGLFESERVRWQREQALAGATQSELEALLQRAGALLEGAGISAKDSIGGGDKSNHGRKKQLMGHVRSLLLRSQASTAEVRALHGLCKELEGRQQRQGQGQ